MRLFPLFAAAFAIAAMSGPAAAQDGAQPVREGKYYGSGEGELTVDLRHIESDIYAISIETVVPIENEMTGCGGGIEGEVILSSTGGNFFVENEDYVPGSDNPMLAEQYCKVELRFDDEGFLILTEEEGCLAYHGASCGFSGTLVHEGAAG